MRVLFFKSPHSKRKLFTIEAQKNLRAHFCLLRLQQVDNRTFNSLDLQNRSLLDIYYHFDSYIATWVKNHTATAQKAWSYSSQIFPPSLFSFSIDDASEKMIWHFSGASSVFLPSLPTVKISNCLFIIFKKSYFYKRSFCSVEFSKNIFWLYPLTNAFTLKLANVILGPIFLKSLNNSLAISSWDATHFLSVIFFFWAAHKHIRLKAFRLIFLYEKRTSWTLAA